MTSCTIRLKEIASPINGTFSHLLELDEIKILINCGTPDRLSTDMYNYLDIEQLDIVLLSHSNISFTGALPYIFKKNFQGRIYATLPVKSLGKLILLEKCHHILTFKKEVVYSENDIEKTFEAIQGIKYLQPVDVNSGVSVVAYNSGHTLGGTVWKISKNSDVIVFGLKFDHRKVNHLNGIDMASLPKNAICIFDTGYVKQVFVNRKDRNKYFWEIASAKLKAGKKILVIIGYDIFLEIGLVLDEIIKDYNARFQQKVKASCIGFVAQKFSEVIKSMVEWSGDNAIKEFLEQKENPLAFNNIRFFQRYTHVNINDRIFVTFEGFGYASKMFEIFSRDNENLILNFTDLDIKVGMIVEEIPNFIAKQGNTVSKEEGECMLPSKEENVVEQKTWHSVYTDVWSEDGPIFFPRLSKGLPFDDYNEFFSHEQHEESSVQKKEKIITVEKEELHEEVEIWRSHFKLNCEILHIMLDNTSDFNSSINVLEFISPQKLILIPTNLNLGKLYFYKLQLNENFKDVMLFEKEISLNPDSKFSYVLLDQKFYSIHPKKIGNDKYIGFRGLLKNNELQYISPISCSVRIGNVDLNSIRKKLAEKSFQADIYNDILSVDGQIKISKNGTIVMLEGENKISYYLIREVLYKNIAYLDQNTKD
eukprot:jgi/Antlo1/1875/1553